MSPGLWGQVPSYGPGAGVSSSPGATLQQCPQAGDRGARGGGSALARGCGALPPHSTVRAGRPELHAAAKPPLLTMAQPANAYGGLSGPQGTQDGALPEGFP